MEVTAPDFPPAVLHTLSGDHTPGGPRVQLAVHESGRTDATAVVFCHGFPELAYSWRHQLAAVADAGFRAIAPDQRGYGGSSIPPDADDYSLSHLCGDLADLLDALEIDRAVFVGHDWGGFVAWAMPVLHPDRVAGVVGVCTPNTPFPRTDWLRRVFGDDEKMYMLWFQRPGEPEAAMDPRVRVVFDKLARGGVDPAVLLERGMARGEGGDFNPFRRLDDLEELGEPVLNEAETQHFVRAFERTGFGGAINWYRNMDRNAAEHPDVGTSPLGIPTLMITAEWDPALPPSLADKMGSLCSDLETHMVARAGHWLQQEAPEEVNAILVDWLTRRFG